MQNNLDDLNWFEHLSPGQDVFTNDNDIRVLNDQIIRCSQLNEWSSVWHIFGAAQALKIDIKQVHPLIRLNNQSSMYRFLNSKIECISRESQGVVNLLWTHTLNDKITSNWQPNHFVCLLPNNKDYLARCLDLSSGDEADDLNTSMDALKINNKYFS